jgi:hypothetical protein
LWLPKFKRGALAILAELKELETEKDYKSHRWAVSVSQWDRVTVTELAERTA